MGGAVSRAPQESTGNSSVRGRHDTRATPGNKTRDSRPLRGTPSPKPLHQHPSQVPPAAQVKGRAHPQPSGHWEGQQEQHGTGRQSVSGGRRVTTSATGETTTKRKTDGEEARGGKRRREMDARAGKVTVDMEHGRGDLRGGGERGDHSHHWDQSK